MKRLGKKRSLNSRGKNEVHFHMFVVICASELELVSFKV